MIFGLKVPANHSALGDAVLTGTMVPVSPPRPPGRRPAPSLPPSRPAAPEGGPRRRREEPHPPDSSGMVCCGSPISTCIRIPRASRQPAVSTSPSARNE